MDHKKYPIVALLQGFEWFDEGLQRALKARRWPALTRPESMVMIHVLLDVTRPTDIARSLRLTRQAVHASIAQMIAKGLFVLVDDPTDGRMRVVKLTRMGEAMRKDANAIVESLTVTLKKRLGSKRYKAFIEALGADWGDVVDP